LSVVARVISLVLLTSCGDSSGPNEPDVTGTWRLVSVDGQSLPVLYYPTHLGKDSLVKAEVEFTSGFNRSLLLITRMEVFLAQRTLSQHYEEVAWSFDGTARNGVWPMWLVYTNSGLRSGDHDDMEFRAPNDLTLYRTFEGGRRAWLFRR